MKSSFFVFALVLVIAQTFPIQNVVVLMLENRSFDHMCGFLKRINPAIEGLTGKEKNPYNVTDPTKGFITVNDQAPNVARFDPDHSLQGTTEKIFGKRAKGLNPAPMDGFAQRELELKHQPVSDIMNMHTANTIPVMATLATEFALFDHWFASVPGPTHPNRLFAMSATSHGSIDNYVPNGGYPQDTIFDRVAEVGKTWHLYYTDSIWATMLGKMRSPDYKQHFRTWAQLLTDIKTGKLPNYSWLEPRFGMDPTTKAPAQDQHPDHAINAGEGVIKEVYEAIRAGPQWNTTLLIVTYDEHGGFYDHFPTPQVGIPNPDGIPAPPTPSHFNFDRLGIRVPTLAISPWIPKGTLVKTPSGPTATSQYDHTSIAATVHKLFGTKSFLTKRDEWAGTFEGILSETQPRTDCPLKLPNPVPSVEGEIETEANMPLNDLQCDYLRMFPVANPDCNMNQLQWSAYVRQLNEEYFK